MNNISGLIQTTFIYLIVGVLCTHLSELVGFHYNEIGDQRLCSSDEEFSFCVRRISFVGNLSSDMCRMLLEIYEEMVSLEVVLHFSRIWALQRVDLL
jgi:hypothetical protein